MTRYYDELAVYERNGFDIIVDKSYEDLHPNDLFDDIRLQVSQEIEPHWGEKSKTNPREE